ncbi:MAG: aminotransferase class V-fold PLP-dependent enzyme [Eubacterium sp.]|nr:aminotransferase class V-fold PLP-dependent enzyme [Eubacterium sp.]
MKKIGKLLIATFLIVMAVSVAGTPAGAKKKTKLLVKDAEMKYSSYCDSRLLTDGVQGVNFWVENPKKKATYTAVSGDKNVAIVEKNTNKDLDSEYRIVTTGLGSTKITIYEKLKKGKKKTIGTIPLKVKREDLGQVAFERMNSVTSVGFNNIWLKTNLNQSTFDLEKKYYENIFNNKKSGLHLKKNDYKVKYYTDDPEIVTVDDKGVITAKKNGETEVEMQVFFIDNSMERFSVNVRVSGAVIVPEQGVTIDNIRDSVIGLNTPVQLADGTTTPLINFDNAATTPALKQVQDELNKEMEMYGSIGRGFSQKSNHSTDIYNATRDKVIEFLGADPETYTCFYVNSTTDGLNKLASALVESKDDLVLATRIEHHANDLSWRERCHVIYAEVDKDGRVIYDEIEKLLKKNKGKVKYVTITAASNVTGYVTDVHRVAKMAHKYGAKIIVDGAQIVAHRKFKMLGDTPEENIDFMTFSAHKMYSPYGGGAVVGLADELNKHMPTFYGGGTIKVVGDNWQIYKDAPARYEAGSPNYPGVIGLGKAIEILSGVGFDAIEAHEKVLTKKLVDGLKKLPNIIIYGDSENLDDRVGVVTFNFKDINSYMISQKLSELGAVATRRGAFCAHPYVWRLMGISDEQARDFENCVDMNTAGMVRVSFGIYNTEEEVDRFLEMMPKVMEEAKKDSEGKDITPEY